MSIISSFYNETFTQVRRSTGSYTASDVTTTVSTFTGLFRPVTENSKLFVESNVGKEADVVCDDSNSIRVGDQLTGSIHGTLEVLGVSDYTDLDNDSESHLDIRVVKK